LGVLLGAQNKIVFNESGRKETFDSQGIYKSTDIGAMFGIGVEVPLKKSFLLTLEARNSIGLTDISGVPEIGDGSIKTNLFNVLLGVHYTLYKNKKKTK